MRDEDVCECVCVCVRVCDVEGGSGLKKTPNKMCFDGGPLSVLSQPLWPAFITASGEKQMGHNKSPTIKHRV